MRKYKRILGIDVGMKCNGWCFVKADTNGSTSGYFEFESFAKFSKSIKLIIDGSNPQVIITGKPNMFYNVIAAHNKLIGIICLIAEKKKIPVIEVNDMTARSKVHPGHAKKKSDIQQFYKNGENEDEIDAIILATWGKLSLND